MILTDQNHFINFCDNMEIPLIVCTEERDIIFNNKSFKILFAKELYKTLSEYLNITCISEKQCYYTYKESSNLTLKIRWDIALKENKLIYITARVIEHIYIKHPQHHLSNLLKLPISVFTKDKNLIYVQANSYANDLTDIDSIEKMSDYDLFSEKTATHFRANDNIVLDTKKDLIAYEYTRDLYLNIKQYREYNNEPYVCAVGINIRKAHKNLLLQELKNSAAPNIDINLTKAEVNCINLMVLRKTSKDSDKELKLSPKTIEFHLANAKAKLDCYKTSKLAYMIGKYHAHFLPGDLV